MGIFSSIKKAIGFGSSESKEAISLLDDNCACGGNCTCGQAEVKEEPKAETIKTVLPNGSLKEEKIEEFEDIRHATQPGRTTATKPKAKKKPAAKKTTTAKSTLKCGGVKKVSTDDAGPKAAVKPKAKKASNKAKAAKKK